MMTQLELLDAIKGAVLKISNADWDMKDFSKAAELGKLFGLILVGAKYEILSKAHHRDGLRGILVEVKVSSANYTTVYIPVETIQ